MAKVFIEETTLTKIGNAIRSKTGKTELIDPAVMDVEITNIPAGGGSDDIPAIELTGSCSYACAGRVAADFIKNFPNKITTKDLTTATYMFYYSSLETIPFELNFKKNSAPSLTNLFSDCTKLKNIPDIDTNSAAASGPGNCNNIFYNCYALENPPRLYNIRPSTISSLFYNCRSLKYLPEDYFNNTWNVTNIVTSSGSASNLFYNCYALRKIPTSLFELIYDFKGTSSSSLYYNFAFCCYVLDEVVNMPVSSVTSTSNLFSTPFSSCGRLSKFTFKINDDGTPKTANWKSQTLDLSFNVGTLNNQYLTNVYTYSDITEDKRVTNQESYEALKNDPNWFTTEVNYSRYNHDSAVETINSLPDTSAYLATAGGTNTIKFKKTAGTNTDGGAIENLTAEEIAVATAKGWTVTLS